MNPTPRAALNESERLEARIRERAYFLWLERGRPPGEDCDHWFTAKQQLLTESVPPDADRSPPGQDQTSHFTIEKTLATHLADPAHRFHAPGQAHDARLDVVAGEARQRVRGRHHDSSLRAQPKKPQ